MPFISHETISEWKQICTHPEHNPPGMITLPAGKHNYMCPGCGHTQNVIIKDSYF